MGKNNQSFTAGVGLGIRRSQLHWTQDILPGCGTMTYEVSGRNIISNLCILPRKSNRSYFSWIDSAQFSVTAHIWSSIEIKDGSSLHFSHFYFISLEMHWTGGARGHKTTSPRSAPPRIRSRGGIRGVTIPALDPTPESDFNSFGDIWWLQLRIQALMIRIHRGSGSTSGSGSANGLI